MASGNGDGIGAALVIVGEDGGLCVHGRYVGGIMQVAHLYLLH